MLNFDPASLMASIVVGGIGFGLFLYGKKQQRWPHLVVGLALMVYPYFVGSAALDYGIAVALCVALAVAVRAGL